MSKLSGLNVEISNIVLNETKNNNPTEVENIVKLGFQYVMLHIFV